MAGIQVHQEFGSSSTAAMMPFPAGLRVLLVDDDPTCLKIVGTMLRLSLYEVVAVDEGLNALALLRERHGGFDVVITDVHMPIMDGFALLEHIVREFRIPVIMMSADDKFKVVARGLESGACFYFLKPLTLNDVQNVWQHVVRNRKEQMLETSTSVHDPLSPPLTPPHHHQHHEDPSLMKEEDCTASSFNNEDRRLVVGDRDQQAGENKRKQVKDKQAKDKQVMQDDHQEGRDHNNRSSSGGAQKKARVVWTPELHDQFLEAIDFLGIDKAVPKRILELMNVSGLTRENIASHLQKYRLFIRRLKATSRTMDPRNPRSLTGLLGSLARPSLYHLQQGLLPQIFPEQQQQRPGTALQQALNPPSRVPALMGPSHGCFEQGSSSNSTMTQARTAQPPPTSNNQATTHAPNNWQNRQQVLEPLRMDAAPAMNGNSNPTSFGGGNGLIQTPNQNRLAHRGVGARPPYNSTLGQSFNNSSNLQAQNNISATGTRALTGRFNQDPDYNTSNNSYPGIQINSNGAAGVGGMNVGGGDGGVSYKYKRMEEALNNKSKMPCVGGVGSSGNVARSNMMRASGYNANNGMVTAPGELTGAPAMFPNLAAQPERPPPAPAQQEQQQGGGESEIDSWLQLLSGNSATESDFDQYLYGHGNQTANQGGEQIMNPNFDIGEYQFDENNPAM